MTSLVALTFYKDFVLAPRYAQPFPTIDWSGDEASTLEDINQVQDEAMRDLLRKEFFSRRMVASSLVLVQGQAHLLTEKRAKALEVAKSINPEILDAYVGDYEIAQLGITLIVSRVQDGLFVEQQGEGRAELLPSSETHFFLVAGNDFYDVEFTFDETNRVTGLIVTVNGQSYMAKRKAYIVGGG